MTNTLTQRARDVAGRMSRQVVDTSARNAVDLAEAAAIISELVERIEGVWQDIETAPRDGSFILAIVAPNDSRHLGHQSGRAFVIRHEGVMVSGFDLGWAVYPGFGGASDCDFTHWMPLPQPPSVLGKQEGEG